MNQTRREMFTTAGAAAAMAAAAPQAFAAWEPNERYPDPAIQIARSGLQQIPHRADARSSASRPAAAGTKGRSGSATARCLLWSDIPNNRIMRWDEETGRVSIFRKPSNFANGNTRDRQGRLVSCEQCAPRHAHRI